MKRPDRLALALGMAIMLFFFWLSSEEDVVLEAAAALYEEMVCEESWDNYKDLTIDCGEGE